MLRYIGQAFMRKLIIFFLVSIFVLLLVFSEKVFAAVVETPFPATLGSQSTSLTSSSFKAPNTYVTNPNPYSNGMVIVLFDTKKHGYAASQWRVDVFCRVAGPEYAVDTGSQWVCRRATCPVGTITMQGESGPLCGCPNGGDYDNVTQSCVEPEVEICSDGFPQYNGQCLLCLYGKNSNGSCAGPCPEGSTMQGYLNGQPYCKANCPSGFEYGGVNGVYGCYPSANSSASSSSSAASSANNSSSGASSGTNSSAGSGGDNGTGGDNGGDTGGSNSSSGTASSAGQCDPTDDDYLACIGAGSNPLPEHTQTESGYTSISQVNQAFFNRVSQSAVAQGLSNVANLVDTSGGECPLLEIDLRGTPLDVELSTDIHCQLFLMPEVQVTLSTIMLIIFSFFCYRIFASS